MSDYPWTGKTKTYYVDEIEEMRSRMKSAEKERDELRRELAERVQGWQLVPIEPTKAMLYAAERGIREVKYNRKGMTIREWSFAKIGYTEMLAAAPQPPQED